MVSASCKKEGMPAFTEPSSAGGIGHVYLDVRKRQLYCLNERAKQLHAAGVPLTAADLIEHPLRTLGGAAVTEADLPLVRAWRDDEPCEATFVFPEESGPFPRVTWNASPIRDPDGTIVAVVGAVNVGAAETDWQTLAGLAHDLRTPLQALKLLLTLMERNDLSEGDAADVLSRVQASANRALEIGMDLLEWCRLPVQIGRRGPTDWFPLGPFLRDLASEQQAAAHSKALNLKTDLAAAAEVQIRIDRQRLGRLLSNLLSNAVRYTDSGRVEFKAGWQNDPAIPVEPASLPLGATVEPARKLVLSVVDTGAGISVEEQESIFQPFERGRAGKEGDSGGSGLGLAIVDRLVDELGLSLEVYSEYGRGSAFHLSLPAEMLQTGRANG
jgi:signal transduction histidine kinase